MTRTSGQPIPMPTAVVANITLSFPFCEQKDEGIFSFISLVDALIYMEFLFDGIIWGKCDIRAQFPFYCVILIYHNHCSVDKKQLFLDSSLEP